MRLRGRLGLLVALALLVVSLAMLATNAAPAPASVAGDGTIIVES